MRKILTVLLCLGALISWQICQETVVDAKEKMKNYSGKAFECSIAGTWSTGQGDGFMTIVPLDPTGRRFSVMIDGPIPEDPSLYGVFEYAKAVTQMRGVAVKVSNNLYNFTLTQIAVDVDEDTGDTIVLGKFQLSGKTKFIDCNTRVSSYSFKFLDPDGNEVFPEYCGYATGIQYRYDIVPHCDDLLPFPEVE